MNTKKRKVHLLSLYLYRLKYLFAPGVVLGFISIIPVFYFFAETNKETEASAFDFLCLKNLSPMSIFLLLVPLLTILAFKYMFSATENDFISSLSYSKKQLFITNILAVLTYTIVPLIVVYCQNIKSKYPFETETKYSFSSKAIIGYLLCCILTMSCIIIGLSLSNNLYLGAIMGYALIFIPRIILFFVTEKIQKRCPYLPTSELPRLLSKKLNIVTLRLLGNQFTYYDLKSFSNFNSILYTGLLGLFYLIIGYVIFNFKKNNSNNSVINLFKPGHIENRMKYFKKLIYAITSIAVVGLCIVLSTKIYCKHIEKEIPTNKEIKSVHISFIGLDNIESLYDENHSPSMTYQEYCIQNHVFTSSDLIDFTTRKLKETVKNSNNFSSTRYAYFYCKVDFKTSKGTYSRYMRFINEEQYENFKSVFFNAYDLKKMAKNLPDFTSNVNVCIAGLEGDFSTNAYEKTYNTFRDELKEMSTDELKEYIKPIYVYPNVMNYIYNVADSIHLNFTNSKKNIDYDFNIEISKRLPKTQKVFVDEYIKLNNDKITDTLNHVKSNQDTFVSITDIENTEFHGTPFTEQKQLAYVDYSPTEEQKENLNQLIDIIFNNINNPQDDYSYLTLHTADTKFPVPLNLKDNKTAALLSSLSK